MREHRWSGPPDNPSVCLDCGVTIGSLNDPKSTDDGPCPGGGDLPCAVGKCRLNESEHWFVDGIWHPHQYVPLESASVAPEVAPASPQGRVGEEPTTSAKSGADPLLIEPLAVLEHLQWMHWVADAEGKGALTPEWSERWKPLMIPYAQLPEKLKEHDRKWARLALAIVQEALR